MNASAAVETQLLDAAEQLLPELGRRRREIDELRHLPQDLADKLAKLGFYRLVVPEALGGLGIRRGPRCGRSCCGDVFTPTASAPPATTSATATRNHCS